ncbi:hypothetical protein J5N97_004636 [Dioscorea zingiberensis]|uniref:non-specific serine/threonine protein kinase n=1 Tax=Dioscorea zingiberensis TaxID=325984 RepID=A0A9D5HR59_9LILI|nr:hypothetical protein J5N97_004636 [Dioscorea zingiberensis]
MLPRFLFLCLLVWGFFGTLHCQFQPLVPSEVDALKIIGEKLGKQWDFTVDPCSRTSGWVDPNSNKDFAVNVTCGACNDTSCHVTSVILKGQNLTGSLPDEFFNLTSSHVISSPLNHAFNYLFNLTFAFLINRDLTRNYLNGTIPVPWASLPLTKLSLLGNRISGKIPKELGHITTLQELVLEDNMLEGTIPTSLGNLVNLEQLHLSGNYFTGELPELLANLKNLIDLRIDGNPISGKIPPFMGNWKKLNILQMQGTSLEGPFPSNFSALEALTDLMVSPLERGDGQFPPLWNMKNLKRLVLRNISLSGELPDYIGNMKKLKTLDLSFNNFTGKIPENFSSLKKTLKFLFLTNNRLTRKIPNWILESDNRYYDLSYNSFDDASAPEECYRGVNLVSSYSTSNNTKIPTCFTRNHPCSGMAKNSELFINCGGDEVTIGGNVYQEDQETQGPSYYKASGKNWAFSSTGYFVRKEEGKHIVSTNMSVFNMPDSELYKTARLSPLSLKYYGLCLQNGNYTVNLHFAEIMFTDDQTFSSLGRRFFDVSIQGRKVLQNFNIVKEANGTGLPIKKSYTASVTSNTLEIHFQWAGKGTTAIPQRSVYGPLISAISVTSDFEDSKLSTGAILGIVAAACVLIALISIFIWFCLRRKIAENNELQGLELQTGYFTLRQIKAATSNFDPANKIGEGGFGPVYKGVLPDGSVIAVKQLSSKSKQGNREFINEIGMISALHHPNLVKLFGCCIEGNQLLLVYEYMENNSLASALFGPERDRLKLDWQTRRRICLSIARGLVYLHEESRLKIVHRDIKATNVLLDKDRNAKISDFGLARLSDEDESHISTRIAGTIGYMAPEYAMRGYLTDKADVYSFGVVILEIVSGVSNGKYQLKDNHVCLLDWAYILQEQGNLLELVDQRLGPYYSEDEALQMLNLALTCTNPSPTLRPTMSTVVSILDGNNPNSVACMMRAASSFHDRQSASLSTNEPLSFLQSRQLENTMNSSKTKLLSDYSE